MRNLVKETKIKDMHYTPHMLTLNGHMQALVYLVCEISLKIYFPFKYEREIFKLSDGGTIAIDWCIDHEGALPRKNSERPILCLISGLSGGNDNYYLYSMMKQATLSGYKCVVINFRGASGVKLTSPMIYWMNTWTDLKEPIEYIQSKYCSNDYIKRNLYAFAVSLGAGMLTKYLIHSGDQCVLTGALPYGLFFNLKDNVNFFKRNAFKLYDKVMGFNYYMILKSKAEEFREHFGNQ